MAGPLRRAAAGLLVLATGACGGCASVTPTPTSRALAVWNEHAQAAHASQPAVQGARLTLTVDQAVARAVAHSGEAAVLRAQARARRARGDAEAAPPNPELRVTNVRLDRLHAGSPTLDAALRFRFEPPGTLAAARDAEHLEGAALEAEAATAELEAAAEVRRLFSLATLLGEAAAVSEAEAQLYERLLAQLEAAAARGRAVRTDLAGAALGRADAIAERHAVATRRAEVLAELRRHLAVPPGTELELVAPEPAAAPVPELARADDQAVAEAALTARPELAAAAARVARGEALVGGTRWLAWPRLGFAQLGWERTRDDDPFAFAVGVALDLPLFDAGGAAEAEARAQLAAWRAEEEALALQVGQEAIAAARRVRAAQARLAFIDETLTPAAEQAQAASEAAEAVGAEDPSDRARAERQVLRARRARIEALLALSEAVAAFERAVGGAGR